MSWQNRFSNTTVIVGGGYSGTSTLMQTIRAIIKSSVTNNPNHGLSFIVIDSDGAKGSGIAFNPKRNDPAFLLDDVASKVYPPDEFIQWLRDNAQTWLQQLKPFDNPAVNRWLNRYAEQIAADDYGNLNVPRILYGIFREQKLVPDFLEEVKQANLQGLVNIEVDFRKGEVTAIKKYGQTYNVEVASGQIQQAHNVVMCMGPPPPINFKKAEQAYLVSGLYYDPEAVSKITQLTDNLANPNYQAVIMGANAAFGDLANILIDHKDKIENPIVVISKSGNIAPDRKRSADYTLQFLTEGDFASLSTAQSIFDAIEAELDHGVKAGFTEQDVKTAIFPALKKLVSALNQSAPDEWRRYLQDYPNKARRLLRSFPDLYREQIDELINLGKIIIVQGDIESVEKNTIGTNNITYTDQIGETITVEADMIINCLGPSKLKASNVPLIISLINNGMAQVNGAGTGFMVDEGLRTSSGVIITGQLLEGADAPVLNPDKPYKAPILRGTLSIIPSINIASNSLTQQIQSQRSQASGPSKLH